MTIHDLEFPVLEFQDDVFTVYSDPEDLGTVPRSALSRGWFDGALVIDSSGTAVRTLGAKCIDWVRPRWGRSRHGTFNWLLGMVKVDVIFDEQSVETSVTEVIQQLKRSTVGWHGLESRGDFYELERRISNAASVCELIGILA